MVSTRRGEYTTPEKTPHLPPHDEDNDNNNNNNNNNNRGEGVAVGASLNYDDNSSSVDDKESINDEDDNYHNNNYDDDTNEEEEEAAAVRNNKRRHGTIEEEGGDGGREEDNEEEDVVVMWLSVKVMSKMSDGELCTHFNTKLQKKGSSICQNRQCNCLAILHIGNARLSIARYMTWFARQTQYEQNSIVLQWIRYSTVFRMKRQCRTNYFLVPYIDDGTEDVPVVVRNHVLCTQGLKFVFRFGRTRYGTTQS